MGRSGALASIDFEDIYLPMDPEGPWRIRNISESGSRPDGVTLQSLPPVLMEDARSLRRAVLAKWDADGRPEEFRLDHGGCSYRVALIWTRHGLRGNSVPADDSGLQDWTWCLRRLAPRPKRIEDLGLPATMVEDIRALGRGRGLMLVSGSFGSGKTTLVTSFLKSWVEDHAEVGVSLEDPPEIPMSAGCTRGMIHQVHLPESALSEGIRAARRWSPRFVMVGDIQMPEVAREVLRMSLSGPMVVSSIHASDPVRALMNLVSFAADTMSEELARDMVAESIQCVLHLDRRNGRLHSRLASIAGKEDFARRNLIRRGRFDILGEALGLSGSRDRTGISDT